MNIELLNRVADQIEAHPENLAMDNWAVTDIDLEDIEGPGIDMIPECGTAACVAGWTLIESGYEPVYTVRMVQHERGGKWYRARNLTRWEKNGLGYDASESGALAAMELDYAEFETASEDLGEASPVVCREGYAEASLFMCTWYGPETITMLLRQWAENPDTDTLRVPPGWRCEK